MRDFCEIISAVEDTSFPMNIELVLGFAITKPVEIHIPQLGFFHLDVFVGETGSGGIVSL